jgi:hypothetical protein
MTFHVDLHKSDRHAIGAFANNLVSDPQSGGIFDDR